MMHPYSYNAPQKTNVNMKSQGGRKNSHTLKQTGHQMQMRDPFQDDHRLNHMSMFGGMDMFEDMHKRMQGNMGNEFGTGSIHNEVMNNHFGGDVFGEMMNFDSGFGNMHKKMEKMMSNFGNMDLGSSGNQGNCVMRSYTMNSHIDENGKRYPYF